MFLMRWPAFAAGLWVVLCGIADARADGNLTIDERIKVVDAWTVGFNRTRNSCMATATYGDDTTMSIGLDGDNGDVFLAITNPNWQSIQDGKQYRIQIASVGGGRWQGNFFGVTRGDSDKGIISNGLKEAFVKELVRSPGIAVSLASRTIAKINLEGSPAAFAAVFDCQSSKVASAPNAPGQPKSGRSSKGTSSGTGFAISSRGDVLTNNHVVDGCTSITLEQSGQSGIAGSVIARDRTNDLAVLRSNLKPGVVFALKPELRVGENVAVFGFPLSDRLATTGNFTVGYVSALAGLGDDTSKIQISAPIQPGNSGGPVLDHTGNVVGVIVSTATPAIMASASGVMPQNINFAIKASIARTFLDASGVKGDGDIQSSKIFEFADLAERARLGTVKIVCEQ
jgi:serine protease Do